MSVRPATFLAFHPNRHSHSVHRANTVFSPASTRFWDQNETAASKSAVLRSSFIDNVDVGIAGEIIFKPFGWTPSFTLWQYQSFTFVRVGRKIIEIIENKIENNNRKWNKIEINNLPPLQFICIGNCNTATVRCIKQFLIYVFPRCPSLEREAAGTFGTRFVCIETGL